MKASGRDKVINDVKELVGQNIDLRKNINDEEIRELITEFVFEKSRQMPVGLSEKHSIIEQVFNSLRRLDILQPIIDDETVTEIMINGPDNIFIERFGKVVKLDVHFDSTDKLEDVIQGIVAKVNRNVNESTPIVDARLQDSSRVSIVLPPVALNGPIVTIRKFPHKAFTMQQLVLYGSISSEAAEVLDRMVKAKYNIFISGGTGSGKTTFLNALSGFIPKDERIITIEDSAELRIEGINNIVRLETRNPNTEGRGEITIRDLIRCSLRMRPERIIVGEVRGVEALDMLQAFNTGHDGSLSTGHANSCKDMLSRLETMALCGAVLPLEAIRQQIVSAIDIIIHLSRLRDKSRRVIEISEVTGYTNGRIQLNPLYAFHEEGDAQDGRVLGALIRTENKLFNMQKLKLAGISDRV